MSKLTVQGVLDAIPHRKKNRQLVHLQTRWPPELHKALKDRARQQGRSLNTMLMLIVADYFLDLPKEVKP